MKYALKDKAKLARYERIQDSIKQTGFELFDYSEEPHYKSGIFWVNDSDLESVNWDTLIPALERAIQYGRSLINNG